jgi:hypothetical protein
MHVQLAAVRRDEISEGALVAGSGASERGVRHRHILASTADGAGPVDRLSAPTAPPS